jgi:hypothetical protein
MAPFTRDSPGQPALMQSLHQKELHHLRLDIVQSSQQHMQPGASDTKGRQLCNHIRTWSTVGQHSAGGRPTAASSSSLWATTISRSASLPARAAARLASCLQYPFL